MPTDERVRIVPSSVLSADEAQAVARLAERCNRYEGLDLKLELVTHAISVEASANAFLAYDGDELIGFCSLDGRKEIEACGMVHPERRRAGIGKRLLDATIAETQRRDAKLLLICEDASQSGQGFMQQVGGQRQFSEERMVLGKLQQRAFDEQLTVRVADLADTAAVVRVIAAAFNQTEAHEHSYIVRDLVDPTQRVYLALLDDEPVGALRAVAADKRIGIYGFGVHPAYQRRGFGRQMLTTLCMLLLAEGQDAIFLEVETNNTRAQALYRSCGFVTKTVYGYYCLDQHAQHEAAPAV